MAKIPRSAVSGVNMLTIAAISSPAGNQARVGLAELEVQFVGCVGNR